MIDATYLKSNWTCIYGSGCKGVLDDDATKLQHGCCSYGAHFIDKKDLASVKRSVARLKPEHGQNMERGKNGKWLGKERDGADVTRKVNGVCIFHNDADFEGGLGCAFHIAALEAGERPMDWKPDVCWQVPMRRSFENLESPDETEKTVVVISEFDRGSWGPGGHDFDWYCSSNTEAHIGSEPVYISNKNEMVALIGSQAYEIAAEACRKHEQMVNQTGMNLAPHPADPQ